MDPLDIPLAVAKTPLALDKPAPVPVSPDTLNVPVDGMLPEVEELRVNDTTPVPEL